jgi:maltose-binding protein MalE
MRLKSSLTTLVGIIAVLALIFGTMGAAAAKTGAKSNSSKVPSGLTLTIWDFFPQTPADTPERVALLKVAQEWAAKTGNKVEEPVPPSNSQSKFLQAAPAGQGPDILLVPHDQIGALQAAHVIAEIPRSGFGISKSLAKKFVPQAISAVTIGGKLWAYPWAQETYGIYYNKSLIPSSFFAVKTKTVKVHGKKEKLQVSPTFDQLVAKAASITGGGKYGMAWDLANYYFDYAFMSAYGGYTFKHTRQGFQANDLGIDNAGSVKGLTYMLHVISTVGIPTSMNYNTMQSLFLDGKVAAVINGPWFDQSIKGKVDYGFAPLPIFPNHHFGKTFAGIQTMVVNKYSKSVTAAESLAQYLSLHAEMPLFQASGRIPVLKSVLSKVSSVPEVKAYKIALSRSEPMPNIPEMAQVWKFIGDALTLAINKQATPQQALSGAAQKIRAAIAAGGTP